MEIRDFSPEFTFTASRSSGPGGQNVNKVSSRVELRFDVKGSALLTPDEKEIILLRLAKKINSEGELILVAQTDRSQLKNKEKAIEKFYAILNKALTPVKDENPPGHHRLQKRKDWKKSRYNQKKKNEERKYEKVLVSLEQNTRLKKLKTRLKKLKTRLKKV